MKPDNKPGGKPLAENRRARFNYEVLETYDAGLVLEGWEVKAIRSGQAQIADSHVVTRNGELFLLNSHITPLKTTSTHIKPDSERTRKLLLHKKEIRRLIGKIKEKGLTLIPLSLYIAGGHIKTRLALARGKKTVDKRRSIEERQWQRAEGRRLRNR